MKTNNLLTLALSLLLTAAALTGCGTADSTSDSTAESTSAETAQKAAETDPYEGLTLYESESGLSIYMADGFEEKTSEGVVCYFQKDNCGMTCQKDDFQTLQDYDYDTDTMTLEEYTAIIMDIYQAGDEVLSDDYGNTYLYYEQDIMGISMAYYGFYHKGTDAFWGTTFFCPLEDAEAIAPDFHLWASSVSVP